MRWSDERSGAMMALAERFTHSVDPAVAGRARRCRTEIMRLLHGLPQIEGEFLRYALVRGTAVQWGYVADAAIRSL